MKDEILIFLCSYQKDGTKQADTVFMLLCNPASTFLINLSWVWRVLSLHLPKTAQNLDIFNLTSGFKLRYFC